MEKLKLILKKALAESAVQVTLRVGQEGEMVFGHSKTARLADFGMADLAWLEGLYKALFPREGLALRAGDLVRGQFSIVNVGKVYLIADPHPPKALYLFFPPSGDLLSQEFMNGLKATYAPPVVEAPPLPPPAPLAEQGMDIFAEGPTVVATMSSEMKAVSPSPAPPQATAAQTIPPQSTLSRAVKPEYTTRAMPGTKVNESIPPPAEVIEHKTRLALIVSQVTDIISQARSVAEHFKLFAFPVSSRGIFTSIMDRFEPHIIFLDDSATDFQDILKRLYDSELDKRLNMTVVLLSKTFRSQDTKAAFTMSVDVIANHNDVQNLQAIVSDAHTQRQATVQSWNEVKAKT